MKIWTGRRKFKKIYTPRPKETDATQEPVILLLENEHLDNRTHDEMEMMIDDGEGDKKLGKISNLDRILVSAGNDLHGVQALERAQLGEDLPHGDRLGEVEDYVALSWAYIIIDCYHHH